MNYTIYPMGGSNFGRQALNRAGSESRMSAGDAFYASRPPYERPKSLNHFSKIGYNGGVPVDGVEISESSEDH